MTDNVIDLRPPVQAFNGPAAGVLEGCATARRHLHRALANIATELRGRILRDRGEQLRPLDQSEAVADAPDPKLALELLQVNETLHMIEVLATTLGRDVAELTRRRDELLRGDS